RRATPWDRCGEDRRGGSGVAGAHRDAPNARRAPAPRGGNRDDRAPSEPSRVIGRRCGQVPAKPRVRAHQRRPWPRAERRLRPELTPGEEPGHPRSGSPRRALPRPHAPRLRASRPNDNGRTTPKPSWRSADWAESRKLRGRSNAGSTPRCNGNSNDHDLTSWWQFSWTYWTPSAPSWMRNRATFMQVLWSRTRARASCFRFKELTPSPAPRL